MADDTNRYSNISETYVSERIQRLPSIIRSHRHAITIIFFEFVGTFILSYGICFSTNTDANKRMHQILVSCTMFLAMTWTSKVTGGHLNPAVTLAYIFKKNGLKTRDGIYYIITQFVAAFFGGLLAWKFFNSVTAPYTVYHSLGAATIISDCLGEILATFFFVLFFLVVSTQETALMKDQFWVNILVPIFFFVCKIMTFRSAVLNPALGFTLQFWQSIESGSFKVFIYGLILIFPPLIGGAAASLFYDRLYTPILHLTRQADGLKNKPDE